MTKMIQKESKIMASILYLESDLVRYDTFSSPLSIDF